MHDALGDADRKPDKSNNVPVSMNTDSVPYILAIMATKKKTVSKKNPCAKRECMLSVEQELTDAKKECLHSNRIIQSFEVQNQTTSQAAVFLLKFVSGNLVHCVFVGSGKGNRSFQLWSHIPNTPQL